MTAGSHPAGSHPVRPRTMKTQYEESDDAIQLRISLRQIAGAVFLGLWLTGWTVGCVALIWMVLTQNQPFTILFAIPFWASWFLVAFLLIGMLTCHERIALVPNGVAYQRSYFSPYRQRFIPISEIVKFVKGIVSVDSESGSKTYGIEIQTLGKSLKFGESLGSVEQGWLIYQLNRKLGDMRSRSTSSELPPLEAGDDLNGIPAYELDQPPSDSRWNLTDDLGFAMFANRGEWSWSAVGTTFFFCLFWNGIVSVFVCVLLGISPDQAGKAMGDAEWWGLFLFLIPFEAIGAAILLAFFIQLIEPFRITTWRIGSNMITHSTKWLGIGRTKAYEFMNIADVEIRKDLASSPVFDMKQQTSNNLDNDANVGILIVGEDRNEICRIVQLSIGESSWMKRKILRIRDHGVV